MIAVDTNVIVRLITGDDPTQVARALELAAEQAFYVSFGVMIESEWVLRSRYGYDRATIATAFAGLIDLVDLRFEDDAGARWAIDRYRLGGELADYCHVAAAHRIGHFASFERRLAQRAGSESPCTIETLA